MEICMNKKESDRSNLIRNDVHADIHGMRCKK